MSKSAAIERVDVGGLREVNAGMPAQAVKPITYVKLISKFPTYQLYLSP